MISDNLLHLWSVGIELENVTAQQTAEMAEELLEARRKIEMLKEDAESLFSWFSYPREVEVHTTKCRRWRENDPDAECTCGYQADYDNHIRVMKEVKDD